ncbi:ATP-binding protein [Flavobacterium tegetincola]|uniref:ATP-binding response regulator n=1 Tax=Flavobacterium tegetincola TaxID=150172 RepID=UPI0004242DB1|nr:ATP-binding protein [Flavobacterium tegetincola]
MADKKSYIPVKVLLSYLALIALVATVGWLLYTENIVFSKTEANIATENDKVLKVSNLLSNIYKNEGYARKTLQSDGEEDLNNYILHTDSLKSEIEAFKVFIPNPKQITLLDTVKVLLNKKVRTIRDLKIVKQQANNEEAVQRAINKITQMEGSLRKLQINDLVKNPNDLGEYQRSVLQKMVAVLNQNIPNDSSNTLTQKALDSMLVVSKTALSDVVRANASENKSLAIQEQKLQKNEVSISEQLRKILNIIEREIIRNTTATNLQKEASLQKTNEIVTYAAIAGFILTVFFSILILSDFSKTESYKKQLEAANLKAQKLIKDREQLISTVSHDLKTPLSTIVGYSELLGNSDLTAKQTHYNKNIKSSSEYISKLVQDLLDFTKIESGKIIVENMPFSLPNVIEEVANNIQAVYTQKEISLQLDIDTLFDKNIVSDPFRLRQILSNLIGNAYKFTEKGSITIEAKVIEHNIQITVKDTGIGIKESSQALVFEEFTQANDGIEKVFGGTGLGLTIARKITESLNGTLTLKSKYGQGSTFYIQLPLIWATHQFVANEPQNRITTRKTRQIVIVDDDSNLLALTAEVLRQKNHIVYPFHSAMEALNAVATIDFDCVITDIQMPNLDGFGFIEQLQLLEMYKQQPILAITGRADLALEVYQKAGFSSVVQKPYSPLKLLEQLDELFAIDRKATFNSSENAASNSNYSLVKLKAFLPDDDVALREVLNSFVKNTHESLLVLRQGINEKNVLAVQEIAHRMYPMFQQIEATGIADLLNDLSTKPLELDEIEQINILLNQKITVLFELFRKDSVL